MPPRDVAPGTTPPAKRPVQRRPRTPPPPTGSPFGALAPATAPLHQAIREATRSVQAAQQRLPARPLPAIPSLAHPTHQQAAAAQGLVAHSLERQTSPNLGSDIANDPRAQRALAPLRQITQRLAQDTQVRVGLQEVHANPDLYGISDARNSELHQQAMSGTLDGATRDTLAGIGQSVITRQQSKATPGDLHSRASIPLLGTVDFTPLASTIGSHLKGNPLAAFGTGISAIASTRPFSDKGVLGRSANDLLTYPAAAIPTAWNTAQTTLEHGPVAGVKTLTDPIAQSVEHPIREFQQHPLFAALLAHGGLSAVGRGAGAAMRSGALGTDAAQLASTARSPVGAVGELGSRVVQPRHYSKSVLHKTIQAAVDRSRQPLRTPEGETLTAPTAGENMPVVAPRSAREVRRILNRRADFVASRANSAQRLGRQQEATAAQAAMPTRGLPTPVERALPTRLRPERDMVAMAMEGTLRPSTEAHPTRFAEDLGAERQRLEAAYRTGRLSPTERNTNRLRARAIDRVLADPNALANEPAIFQAAQTLAQRGNALTGEAVAQGMLAPERAARAKLFPYAQSHMGAAWNYELGDMRGPNGEALPNAAIEAHMRAHGVDPADVAYLPHRPDVRGARAFYQQFRPGQRRNLEQQSRTGAAYAKGATSFDASLPLEHLVRTRSLIGNVANYDQLIHDSGIRHPTGRYFTWNEAEAYAQRANRAPNEATNRSLPGQPDLVPVRAYPARYDEARAQRIESDLQNPTGPGAAARNLDDWFRQRLEAPTSPQERARARNVVLVPAQIVDRLQRHNEPAQQFQRTMQGLTSAFRTTVLPFSVKWLAGNVLESVGRLAAAGATPRDIGIGRRLFDELGRIDNQRADQIRAELIGGQLYGQRGLTVHRTGQEVAGTLGGAVARSFPGRAVSGAVRHATEHIFALNRALEQTTQYAALGKWARRDIQEFTGSWTKAVRAQEGAMHDAARGLLDTAKQQEAARYIDETLGQYSRFSPALRGLVQNYAPFLPWYLASARFVLWTLPAHHPVKTAVLTQAEQQFEQDWRAQHKDVPPGLMSAVPAHGGFVDLARYTPFSMPASVASGDFSPLAGVWMPQTSGLQLALMGKDPFGANLSAPKTGSNPQGKVQGAQIGLVALNQLLESYVPGLSLIRRLREGGGKSYSTSTAWRPQSKKSQQGVPQPSTLSRVFNPFRAVYVSKSRAGRSGRRPTRTSIGLPRGSYSTGGAGSLPSGSYSIGG